MWLGTVWGHWVGLAPETGLCVLGCLGVLFFLMGRQARLRAPIVVVFLLLVTALVASSRRSSRVELFVSDAAVLIEAKVTRVKCREGGCSLRLDAIRYDGQVLEREISLWHPGETVAEQGDLIAVRARLRGDGRGSNPGGQHPWSVAPERWRATATEAPRVLSHGEEAVLSGSAALDHFENRDVRAFLRAILLGDRAELTPELREAFVDTGAAHILAISGLHIGIVAWGFFRLALLFVLLIPRIRQQGRPRVWASILTLLFVWAFVLDIESGSATLRAAWVVTLFLGAFLAGRRPRALNLLGWAATLLFLWDPDVALTASFQLSFAAAFALVLSLQCLEAWKAKRPPDLISRPQGRLKKAGEALVSLFLLGTVAWCVTTPLCLAHFGQAAPSGLFLNMAFIPLASTLTIPLAFIVLFLGLLLPSAAPLLAKLTEGVFLFFLDLVRGWADVVGSSQWVMVDHAVGLSLSLLVLAGLSRRRRLICFALACLLAASWTSLMPSPHELSMTVLDVGHGDAIVLQMPNGQTVMVDTGGSRRESANRVLADRTLLPALAKLGVSSVDLLVISHAHADHVGAAWRLARRIPVRELWLSPCATSHPMVLKAAAAVAGTGGKVRVVDGPSVSNFGDATFEVLSPPVDSRRPDGQCIGSVNDASVVIKVSFAGRRILLTGDIGAEAEEAILRNHPNLEVDVLKVPHHGSRSSSSERFLDATRPQLALVSGRFKQSRMPPHQEVLASYQTRAIPTYLTGRDGAIRVQIGADGRLVHSIAAATRTLRGSVTSVGDEKSEMTNALGFATDLRVKEDQ